MYFYDLSNCIIHLLINIFISHKKRRKKALAFQNLAITRGGSHISIKIHSPLSFVYEFFVFYFFVDWYIFLLFCPSIGVGAHEILKLDKLTLHIIIRKIGVIKPSIVLCTHLQTHCDTHIRTRKGGGTYFHLGGGGAKTKKGTVMSKRALTVYMRIIITNALMKHHCRHI